MVQFRAMADDAASVEDVLAVVILWLRAHPDLVISDARQLQHRGGGGRVVFEVLLTPSARGPFRVAAERGYPIRLRSGPGLHTDGTSPDAPP
ncbi:hypothetical protein [Nonomuraea typhae]|uniref:hypothetical protein n=1 Tax=Nonomuraea typhae TaxID=2603600 RepID=UPI0012FAAF49|nr:hypothetical protein [Nonomuraea typhae]